MAGITLAQAEAQLALYLAPNRRCWRNQSYEIAGRKLTRAISSSSRPASTCGTRAARARLACAAAAAGAPAPSSRRADMRTARQLRAVADRARDLARRAWRRAAPAPRPHRFEMQASFGRGLGGYIGARRDRAATADWNPGGGSPIGRPSARPADAARSQPRPDAQCAGRARRAQHRLPARRRHGPELHAGASTQDASASPKSARRNGQRRHEARFNSWASRPTATCSGSWTSTA
jgi:hypothetical protein